jgi:hypothetical protein
MGAVNRPADRAGPPDWEGSNVRRTALQSQAQTLHVQPAPQVVTAEAVAAWLVG